MKITFLGTGTSQGVPVVACNCDVCTSEDIKDNRLRSSVMVELDGITLIIDTGPDFREQMLRENVKKIDAVLLTHGHKDHIGGLDDVRAFNFILKRPIDVFARAEVHNAIRNDFSYAFNEFRYPGVPDIKLHIVENSEFQINGILVIPIEVMHLQLPVFGFRINDFTYITDASFISEKEIKKIKGSKVLVVNALRKKKHYSHFCLEEALQLADKVQAEQCYLTHISHQMGLYNEVETELPINVKLAYDRLIVEI